MTKPHKSIRSVFSGDEISLVEIWNLFWDRKKFVIIATIVFVILGYIAAKTSPVEYQAKCVMLMSDKGAGGGGANASLLGLAGFAGGAATPGAGNAGNDIGPEIYPIIISSKPFLIELATDSFFIKNTDQKTTIKDYFKKGIRQNAVIRARDFLVGIPGMITSLFKSNSAPAIGVNSSDLVVEKSNAKIGNTLSSNVDIIQLSNEDKSAAGIMAERITLTRLGDQITLTVKMPEAWLSARATQMVLDKLIKYVTKYKTGKQLENVNFLESATAEAEATYKSNQQKVAGFKDNNYGVVFQSVQSREQLLQNEFTLSFTLYNSLVTQLQQAKIQLKKDTPLFRLLEPVYVPDSPAEPIASKIILTYSFIGVFIGILIVLFDIGLVFYKEGAVKLVE